MRPNTYDPAVAFGYLASATAFKAKVGRCRRADSQHLLDVAVQMQPHDSDVLAAAIAFDAMAAEDQPAAGDQLLNFILARMPEGASANITKTEAALREMTPQFGWQTRKDCGLD